MIARSRGHGRRSTGGVTDNFDRASLGANWTVVLGNAAIVGSADLGASASAGIHIAAWAGSSLGDDQFAEMRISPSVEPLMQFQVFCRRRSSDAARYAWLYKSDPAFDFEGSPDGPPAWCFKYDGVPSAQTRLFGQVTTAPAPAAGDVLRLEVTGQNPVTLRGFHNGRLISEATDTTADRVLSGPPGAAYRANSGSSPTYPVRIFTDFAAGTLT